jgi:hypothetical protein
MIAEDLPVEPVPIVLFSRTATFNPRFESSNAVLQPMMPAPMMMTS